jgi:GNAT superfamily N-acetyltransferase
MNLDLRFEVGEDDFNFTSFVYDKINPEAVGRFEITKSLPHSMSINVDEDYQKRGLSMQLISNLVNYIISNEKLSIDTHFYIDDDVSQGFWDKIGMEKTPTTDINYGYEKRILLSDLIERVS